MSWMSIVFKIEGWGLFQRKNQIKKLHQLNIWDTGHKDTLCKNQPWAFVATLLDWPRTFEWYML